MDKLNLLLIDDDQKTLEMLKRDLNELNLANNILTASNGDEAMVEYTKAQKEGLKIDVIISDIVMPVCNGVEFLEKFREKFDPDHQVNIIMLTSKSDKSLVLKTISFGVNHYLLKPWSQQSLMQKIMLVLSNN
jgi:YesN/AraC family two-component response regulator